MDANELKENIEQKLETVEEAQARMAPPWIQYVHKLSALFGSDPEIKMEYDNDEVVLKMMVANEIKADAISQLLPVEKTFGNVTLKINVVPANDIKSDAALYQNAFNNNPAFAFAFQQESEGFPTFTYVCFKRRIVQYYDDNLCDPHGNITTLCQDIAKEIFPEKTGVCFCTDTDGENVGRPLGEWP